MSRRSRLAIIIGAAVLGSLAVLGLAGYLVLTSQWFSNKVRQKVVEQIEKSTGGKAESGPLTLNIPQLQATIHNLVIRGTEPAGAAPLFHAGSITIGLRVISVSRRQLSIESLVVRQPQVYLLIRPDGTTNLPHPKVPASSRPVMVSILDYAVKHFSAEQGLFTLEGQGRTPFHIRAENLQARLAYQTTGPPRYTGDFTADPLDVKWGTFNPIPARANIALVLEPDRIQIPNASLVSAASSLKLSGALSNLAAAPTGTFAYDGQLAVAQWGRILKAPALQGGTMNVAGEIHVGGGQEFSVTGNIRASGVRVRQGSVQVHNLAANAALQAGSQGVRITNLRFQGITETPVDHGTTSTPMNGRVGLVEIRNGRVNLSGVQVSALGGTLTGEAELNQAERLHLRAQVRNLDLGGLSGLATAAHVPYSSRVSGTIEVAGPLRKPKLLTVDSQLTLAPQEGAPPLSGGISFNYNGEKGALTFRNTQLNLASTQIRLSGTLGSVIQVHFESTDLNDLNPLVALFSSAAAPQSLPVSLHGGRALFDGTVRGSISDPQISGQLSMTRFAYSGKQFDRLQSRIALTKSGLTLENGLLAEDGLEAQFSGTVGLTDWKPESGGALAVDAQIRRAPIGQLLILAGAGSVPASGTVSVTARIGGTLGNPGVEASLDAAGGSVFQEPFNTITAHVSYAGNQLQVGSARIVAGSKQIQLTASYQHSRGNFLTGVLRFEASSNMMQLGQIKNVTSRTTGIGGSLQFGFSGVIDLSTPGQHTFWRLASLNGDLAAGGLEQAGQRFGDLHLVTSTRGSTLSAHLTADFAGSPIRGNGEWNLSDDYPGRLQVTFSRLDLLKVQQWLSLTKPGGFEVAGLASGDVVIDGPLKDPRLWTASVRIPEFQVGPAPNTELVAGARQEFLLHNAGPITLSLANSVLKIDGARFMGRATDLAVTGTVSLTQANPLNLRLKGRVDLAMLQDFDPDLTSSGFLMTDATIRGALSNPSINGRIETKNASINYEQFPTGLSDIDAVLLFSGTGATIQTFTAQSGGGTVRATGFAGFEGGQLVFRLHANAKQVRVRYPPGVSTVADASLTWTGTARNNMVSGNITIDRVAFNPRSDLGTLLAKSAQPVRTPSAQTGVLAGMHLDVQIQSAPDITFQSSLAQDIVMEASLRLRGTEANPALLGRINIIQGQLVFFGTKYTINQGSIAFFNPVRVEPVLNVDLETRARGIDVILNISGTPSKLALTPRSDPPLPFNEIVSLLATGRTPSSAESGLAAGQIANTGTSWEQAGASALLAEAVANPVAGRLQRFFGITKLRIDPTMPGVQFNPQARITIEQQITPNITFTYISNVTQSNPLVVQVEWAVNPQWSVVAVRDENGLFGLDFFFKKRFH